MVHTIENKQIAKKKTIRLHHSYKKMQKNGHIYIYISVMFTFIQIRAVSESLWGRRTENSKPNMVLQNYHQSKSKCSCGQLIFAHSDCGWIIYKN